MHEFEQSNVSGSKKHIYTSVVVSISMVLLMLGLVGFIVIHTKKLADYVKENIVLNVYLKEKAKEAEAVALNKKIEANAAVKSSVYISKEAAAKILSQELGEDFIEFLGYNPLLYSIDVYLKNEYANKKDISRLSDEISKSPIVSEVVYQPSLIESLNRNVKIITVIILTFAGLLLFIALGLINNTIQISIYSQRFLIKSMQLVGATNSFIRAPFLKTAVLNGFIAGIFACILLAGILYAARLEIPELSYLEDKKSYLGLFALLLLLGMVISFFSTRSSVSRYLHSKADDLYAS